tara:strand:- start:261 stop:524 length:264 start_codon:yes stop_codon:yes gene_type:complete
MTTYIGSPAPKFSAVSQVASEMVHAESLRALGFKTYDEVDAEHLMALEAEDISHLETDLEARHEMEVEDEIDYSNRVNERMEKSFGC